MTDTDDRQLIEQYSAGRIGSHDVLRRLGTSDYAEIIRHLAKYDLPFPQALMAGREAQLDILRQAVRRAELVPFATPRLNGRPAPRHRFSTLHVIRIFDIFPD